MKKLLLFFVLGLVACQKEDDEDLSPFVGTWTVTEKGIYQAADCSGEIDDIEWRGMKGKGVTITLEINKDGTGTETITGPEPSVTTFLWYDVGITFCFGDNCSAYTMSNNQQSFSVDRTVDPYCIDENYEVTGHESKRACELASTGNQWFPKECHKTKYKRKND